MIRRGLLCLFAAAFAAAAFSASFVVPDDLTFVRKSQAIVLASAIVSRTDIQNDRMSTITTFSIEETLKGSVAADQIDVIEPGGVRDGRVYFLPGVPRFTDGERYLLFLVQGTDSKWRVVDLALGKFHFDTDTLGHSVVLRDLNDSLAFNLDGSKHAETLRSAPEFLNFIREAVNGGPRVKSDYLIPAEPLVGNVFSGHRITAQQHLTRGVLSGPNAASYTTDFGSGIGARWTTMPIHYHSVSISPETGAPGTPPGATAIATAFAGWNGVSGAGVNLIYDGNDASNTTQAPDTAGDGKNTIAFEYDLSAFGAAFNCMSGGLLGLGGPSAVSGPPGGSTMGFSDGSMWYTTSEGDVWMNRGIANCTTLFASGDFASAIMHETGHTLGFRHADQNRDNATACVNTATFECVGTAIMHSVVNNGLSATPQTYDVHAVTLVYPSSAPAAVTGVEAHATSTSNVQVTWTGSCATTCHIYRTADNVTYTLLNPVTTVTTPPYNDGTVTNGAAYLYKVRASNGTESADSNRDLATVIIYTNTIVVGGTIDAVDSNEMRVAIDAVRTLDGIGKGSYTFGTGNPVRLTADVDTIYALDINEMRTNLDTAYNELLAVHPTYTNTVTGGGTMTVKALDFNEVRSWLR